MTSPSPLKPPSNRRSQTRLSKGTIEEVSGVLRSLYDEQRKVLENISKLETNLHITERRILSALKAVPVGMQDIPDGVLSAGTTQSYRGFGWDMPPTVGHASSNMHGSTGIARHRGLALPALLTGRPDNRDRLGSIPLDVGGMSPLLDAGSPGVPARLHRTLSDSDTAVSWGKHRGEVKKGAAMDSINSQFFFAEEDEDANVVGKNLPPQWPNSLMLREELNQDAHDTMGSLMARGLSPSGGAYQHAMERRGLGSLFGTSGQVSQSVSMGISQSSTSASGGATCHWRNLVVNPERGSMHVKDLIGFIVLMHDLLVTPYLIGWDRPVEGPLRPMSWFAATFWTFDLILNFTVGYHHAGEFILTQPEILLNYLRTRFLFDFSLVFLDILSVGMDVMSGPTTEEGVSFIRIAKLMRLLKVARLIRLFWLLEKTSQAYLSKENSINMNLLIQAAKVILALFLSTHILACVWFLCGKDWPSDTSASWLQDAFGADGPESWSASFQYLTALHWTVAQVTLGSSHVVPSNSSELLFNIVLLVTGLLAGSTFVSLFSAKIVEHTASKRDQAVLVDNLQRFLRQNNVDRFLTRRAINQVRKRIQDEDKLGEDDVPALTMLSPALRQELLIETRVPHLMQHDLFRVWAEADIKTLGPLCDVAKFRFLLPQDELFVAGEPGTDSFFIISGRLEYIQMPSHSMLAEEVTTVVPEQTWICEAALWSHWLHVGDCQAVSVVHIMAMNAASLVKVIAALPREVRVMSIAYGKRYHSLVASAVPPYSAYPSDLLVTNADICELFNPRATLYFFRQLLREGRLIMPDEQKFKVEREIKKGMCSVRRCHLGPERMTASLVINLELSDGRCLYRLAVKDSNDSVHLQLGLPEAHREFGELLPSALDRIMHEELGCFSQWIEVTGTEFDEVELKQNVLAMPSVNLVTKHTARLTQPLENLVLPVCKAVKELNIGPMFDESTLTEVLIIPSQTHEYGLYAWLLEEDFSTLEDLNEDSLDTLTDWLQSVNTYEAVNASWGLRSPLQPLQRFGSEDVTDPPGPAAARGNSHLQLLAGLREASDSAADSNTADVLSPNEVASSTSAFDDRTAGGAWDVTHHQPSAPLRGQQGERDVLPPKGCAGDMGNIEIEINMGSHIGPEAEGGTRWSVLEM